LDKIRIQLKDTQIQKSVYKKVIKLNQNHTSATKNYKKTTKNYKKTTKNYKKTTKNYKKLQKLQKQIKFKTQKSLKNHYNSLTFTKKEIFS